MVPLLVNAPNIVLQRSAQRRDAIIAETWWEKENWIVTTSKNRSSGPKAALVTMDASNDDIPMLRGWFLKEKRDRFKRHQSILPGAGSNRRWFTIERERAPNNGGGDDGDGGPSSDELALCYYKRSSSDRDQRCGWIFLNDVLSLTQDVPDRRITIEHPARILRVQSPTPAQHRVWFSTLSKCCRHVRKEVASPSPGPVASPASDGGDRRPSLPYFTEDSARKARESSMRERRKEPPPSASTAKDELDFLREITGGGGGKKDEEPERHEEGGGGEEVPPRKNLGPSMENAVGDAGEECARADTTLESDAKRDRGRNVRQPAIRRAAEREGESNASGRAVSSDEDDGGSDGDGKRPELDGPSSSSIAETAVRAETREEDGPTTNDDAAGESKSNDPGPRPDGAVVVARGSPSERSEEEAEVEPPSYDGRGFEEANDDDGCGARRARSFRRDDGDSSEYAGANDRRLETNESTTGTTTAPRDGDEDLLRASHSFASSQLVRRSSSYRLHFGNEDEDEIDADSDFLNDDWDD